MATTGFSLAVEREVTYALEVTDDACEVVHILRTAVGTFLEVALVDFTTVLTERVGDVEGKVVTSFL